MKSFVVSEIRERSREPLSRRSRDAIFLHALKVLEWHDGFLIAVVSSLVCALR